MSKWGSIKSYFYFSLNKKGEVVWNDLPRQYFRSDYKWQQHRDNRAGMPVEEDSCGQIYVRGQKVKMTRVHSHLITPNLRPRDRNDWREYVAADWFNQTGQMPDDVLLNTTVGITEMPITQSVMASRITALGELYGMPNAEGAGRIIARVAQSNAIQVERTEEELNKAPDPAVGSANPIGRPSRYPWHELRVPGDSFRYPLDRLPTSGAVVLYTTASRKGIPVTITTDDDHVVVTRTEKKC